MKIKPIRFEDAKNLDYERNTVKAILELLAEDKCPITYSDLSDKYEVLTGERKMPLSFRCVLGRIQHYCKNISNDENIKEDLPSLPSIVVNKTDFKPGSGFINCYCEINSNALNLDENDIVRKEQEGCLRCKSWQALYDYLGIEEIAPSRFNQTEKVKNKNAFYEGVRTTKIAHEEISRNDDARNECLSIKGRTCIVCELNMKDQYGITEFIHVHHLKPLSQSKGKQTVDPVKDLVPVCPNCHAAIHSKAGDDCYEPNEIRKMLGKLPLEKY